MSTPVNETVQPTIEEPTVSTQIVEEPTTAEPVSEEAAVEETPAVTEKPAAKEDATEVVPATEESPATATKSTPTKRRTIFNPFGKSNKKEEDVTAVTPTEEAATTAVAAVEEKPKKSAKPFGAFFSRSKSSSKITGEEAVTTAETEAVTELPQIEQLTPIETENIVASGSEEQTTIKENVTEAVEAVEQKATEAVQEVEQQANHLSAAANTKRQSFISKLFSNKNKKQDTKEVEEQAATEVPAAVEPTTEVVEVEEPVEASPATDIETAPQRPSSPLGRLTELFSSKKNKKVATPAKEEEAPTVLVTAVEGEEANVTEPVSTTVAPVVTASA